MADCLAPQAEAAFALSVLTAVSRASEASRHMENAVKFVFQACSHYWEPRAACAQTLMGPPAARLGQSASQWQLWMFARCSWRERAFTLWRAPPGGLWDVRQLAAQERQGRREPPSSLQQSQVQPGSVELNNDVLI